ncbi:MAG: D-glycero-alpha-D-manno-heptose-1,7-bisphosphate 7-phosphatase [Terriglobales bacterium]
MRPAVFFDRDGTLNEELGYVGELERFHIYPYAAAAVRRVNASGWPAILVTNQAGVARGLYTEAQVAVLHQHLAAHLAGAGARLDAIYYCPHHPTKGVNGYGIVCDCRKPKPGLLQRAAAEHELDLARSWIVTDRLAEIGMMQALGGRGALVLTGYGAEDWAAWQAARSQPATAAWEGLRPEGPDITAPDALAAVEQLLAAARAAR